MRPTLDRSSRLPPAAPVPLDGPFTSAMATECGVSRRQLDAWVASGALAHPAHGVFHAAHLKHDLALRVACLRLVVPDGCVATDRTAGWLWGASMVLAPNDHLVTPKVSMFCSPGRRLRNGLTASGERRLGRRDVVELDGLPVTTPLRTACDLGRLLRRVQAFEAMDQMARLGQFEVADLVAETRRFAGYRGVVQLRSLAPNVDAGSQSPGESALRLAWLDAGLPRPRCQVPVPAPGGGWFFLDIGLEDELFGAEYDGADFHDEESKERDDWRRGLMRINGRWTIEVARADDVYGPSADIVGRLQRAWQVRPKSR